MKPAEIKKTKKLLANTRRRITRLNKTSVFERGSQDNEDLIKLQLRKNKLERVLKTNNKIKKRKQ